MTEQEATKFNRGIGAARRAVFGPARSEEIDQLVKEYIGQEQTITLD
jgi:hypothetical protein